MTDVTVGAVDLGAESGRVAAGHFDGRSIQLDIAHRFPTRSSTVNGWTRWDVDDLWKNVSAGLDKLGAEGLVASVGVDTWGVDFGLYHGGKLIEAPLCYRDPHRVAAFADAIRELGAAALFEATGTHVLEINSIFALLADSRSRPGLLESADLLLMLPDLFHRMLSGSSVTEYTAASTTGLFDMRTKRWATSLMDRLGLPTHMLPAVVVPGTCVGTLQTGSSISGLADTKVIVPAAHDTASAVLAIPQLGPDTMFISSGTWSLVGVVLDEPVVNADACRANLTNEGGFGGKVRFLRDVLGLWTLQECRRHWRSEGREVGYGTMAGLAADEPPLQAFIDLTGVDFVAAGDMPGRIRRACAVQGMPVPETVGQIARVAIDSLALAYRLTLEDLESVTGGLIESVAVVGGGTENAVLQQATASATGRPVTCWAGEATALGNAVVQLAALGEVRGLDEIWQVVEASSAPRTFAPMSTAPWDEAANRLRGMWDERRHRVALGESGG
jgi:rhamnulokinase